MPKNKRAQKYVGHLPAYGEQRIYYSVFATSCSILNAMNVPFFFV